MTKQQIKSASPAELNVMIHHMLGDDLTANTDERITEVIGKSWVSDGSDYGWYRFNGKNFVIYTDSTLDVWNNRKGKPYQSDLEAHVAAWRADADDWTGDLNLSHKILGDHFADHWWELRSYVESLFTLAIAVEAPIDESDESIICGQGDTPGVAICRAALLVLEGE